MTAELATSLTVTETDRLLAAEAVVRQFCGWHIAPSRDEQVYTLDCAAESMLLPTMWLTSVDEIADDYGTTYTDADFRFTSWGQLRRVGFWWSANTVVTFTHGYETVPPDVKAIVQALAQRSTDNPGMLRQVGQVGYATTPSGVALGGVLTEAEKGQLAPYKIPMRP